MSLLPKTCIYLTLLSVLAAAAPVAARGSASAPPAPTPMAVRPAAPVATSVPAPEPVPTTPRRSVSGVSVNRQPGSTAYVGVPLLGRAGRATEAVLVVPSRQAEPQTTEPLVEDLTIMSRIIQKSLADGYLLPEASTMESLFLLAAPSQNVGPRLFFPPTGRPKPMYVAGYGALFFLQVDFPLVAPAQLPDEANAKEGDPVWAEARRTLYESPVAAAPAGAVPVEAYNEEKVTLLQSRLTETMRHAANIRLLDPNDWVTMVVRGTAAGELSAAPAAGAFRAEGASCGRTILTLRARKPDIDQYAQGRLDPAQFEQRLQITISR